MGLEQVDVIEHLVQVPAEAEGASVAHGDEHIAVQAEHMIEGQHVQDHLVEGIRILIGAEGVVDQSPVAQHDALRVSGGAGGKDDQCAVLFPGHGREIRDLRRELLDLREDLRDAVPLLHLLQTYELLDLRAVLLDIADLGMELPVIEHDVRLRFGNVRDKRFVGQLHVHRDRDAAGACRGEHRCQILPGGAADEGCVQTVPHDIGNLLRPDSQLRGVLQEFPVALLVDLVILLVAKEGLVPKEPGRLFRQIPEGLRILLRVVSLPDPDAFRGHVIVDRLVQRVLRDLLFHILDSLLDDLHFFRDRLDNLILHSLNGFLCDFFFRLTHVFLRNFLWNGVYITILTSPLDPGCRFHSGCMLFYHLDDNASADCFQHNGDRMFIFVLLTSRKSIIRRTNGYFYTNYTTWTSDSHHISQRKQPVKNEIVNYLTT